MKKEKKSIVNSQNIKNTLIYYDTINQFQEYVEKNKGKDLFDSTPTSNNKKLKVNGLTYLDDLVSQEEQKELLQYIYSNKWESGNKTHRRR